MLKRSSRQRDLDGFGLRAAVNACGIISNTFWSLYGNNKELVFDFGRQVDRDAFEDMLKTGCGGDLAVVAQAARLGVPFYSGKLTWEGDRFRVRRYKQRPGLLRGELVVSNHVPARLVVLQDIPSQGRASILNEVTVEYAYERPESSFPTTIRVQSRSYQSGTNLSLYDQFESIEGLRVKTAETPYPPATVSPTVFVEANTKAIRVIGISNGVVIPIFHDGRWVRGEAPYRRVALSGSALFWSNAVRVALITIVCVPIVVALTKKASARR